MLSERPVYLRFLLDFLFFADASKTRYLVRAWMLALLPSIALAVLLKFVAPEAEHPNVPEIGPLTVLLLVLVVPFLETLLMALPLLGLEKLFGPGPAVVGSA